MELGGGNMRETKFRDHFWVSGGTVNWGGGRAGTGPRWNWRAHSWGGSPFLVKIGSKAVFMVLGCFY